MFCLCSGCSLCRESRIQLASGGFQRLYRPTAIAQMNILPSGLIWFIFLQLGCTNQNISAKRQLIANRVSQTLLYSNTLYTLSQ